MSDVQGAGDPFTAPHRPRLGPGPVSIERRPDGALMVTPRRALGAYPRRLTESLEQWAAKDPDRAP